MNVTYYNNSSSIGWSLIGLFGGIWHQPYVFGFRSLLYLTTPNESSYERLEEVPNIVNEKSIPFLAAFFILEGQLLRYKGERHKLARWNDAFTSVATGLITELPLLFVINIEISAYIWLHEHYCLYRLPWDSAWTWWCSLFAMDFCFYWMHRFAHEVNFMWAGHQTHHSSEFFNLTTALRQGVFQRFSAWLFWLPMSLIIPPATFATHFQFNIVYQFWIHNQLIGKLGPVEYIMNTPSHHRVHHGRNRYCIDKNYAGVLIIWDRMFGTFEEERANEAVVFGLTHQINTWNPVYAEVNHWLHIVRSTWSQPGLVNKLYVLLKGPGWQPGKPRLGSLEDIPDIHAPVKRYSRRISGFAYLAVYCWTHFLLCISVYYRLVGKNLIDIQEMSVHHSSPWPISLVAAGTIYILWTLSNIGYLFDNRHFAIMMELVRCAVTILLGYYCYGGLYSAPVATVLQTFYAASIAFWIIRILTLRSKNKLKFD